MSKIFHPIALALAIIACIQIADARSADSSQGAGGAQKALQEGNGLMDKGNYREALARYREGLATSPDEPSLLFNGGIAAYLIKDFASARELWVRLKGLYPEDWQTRVKLIQTFQALGDLKSRDAERQALFDMRKSGKEAELSNAAYYCREQFEAGGRKLMAFEHFELKGERALRYVFSVLNEKGDEVEYRISLGSYEMTNTIAQQTGEIKKGERLFHLDGYYPWGHATFDFFRGEPSYEETRRKVIEIIEEKTQPQSKMQINRPARKP
jgi:tetratricopeptide (TPR) repeat protein